MTGEKFDFQKIQYEFFVLPSAVNEAPPFSVEDVVSLIRGDFRPLERQNQEIKSGKIALGKREPQEYLQILQI